MCREEGNLLLFVEILLTKSNLFLRTLRGIMAKGCGVKEKTGLETDTSPFRTRFLFILKIAIGVVRHSMVNVLRRLPVNERLSVPKPGKSLLGKTRKIGQLLLFSHQTLITALEKIGISECTFAYKENYAFLCNSIHLKENIIKLCSSALILNWLAGRATGALSSTSTLIDAERWYSNFSPNSLTLSSLLDSKTQFEAIAPLRNIDFDKAFLDILPYAAEVFETSHEIINAFGNSRKTKKSAGIFYTPSDVSDYIVDFTLALAKNQINFQNFSWLDPACGTGCFLISVLFKIAERNLIEVGQEALGFAKESLYGIDVSPIALQSAVYILVIICMQNGENFSLKDILFDVGKNFLVYDSTAITIERLQEFFPLLSNGASFVISNPPYVKSQNCNESKELYLNFIQMMCKLSDYRHGIGGMVVPLSITYNKNKDFTSMRRFIYNSQGSWWFANFDRTPDSLFGDDVKTRNTIVFFKRVEGNGSNIFTTDLKRWSSRTRNNIFDLIEYVELPKSIISNRIPKIGDKYGLELLSYIKQNFSLTLGDIISPLKDYTTDPERLLRNSRTAYNWLPFEMVSKFSKNESLTTKYQYWITESEYYSPIVFALLQSRIAYWYWRIRGDGFHLNNDFIKSLPLSYAQFSNISIRKMHFLGYQLWGEMLSNQVISNNSGITTTTYCPYVSECILDEIDQIIINEYKLPINTNQYLKKFIENVVVAGRHDELFTNHALKKWIQKE